MKRIKNVLILLLLGIVVAGCGLKNRRAEKIDNQYPEWGQTTVQAVAARKVAKGMTEQMVTVALGKPDFVNQEGGEEKWAYGINVEGDIGAVIRKQVFWVYFRGEKVVRTEGNWNKLGYTFYEW